MNELGTYSKEEHLKILELVRSLNREALFVGPEFGKVVDTEKHFTNTSELNNHLGSAGITGKQILIKGSRGIALEKAMDYL